MAQLSKKNPVPLVISTQAPATIAQSSDTFTPSTAAFVQSLESIATFIKEASRPSYSSEYSQHCSEYDSENDSEHDSEYHSEYGSKYNSEYDSEYDSECSFEESSKKEVEGILTVNKEETSRKNGKKVAANEPKADLAVGTLPEGVKNIRFGESTQVALSKNSLKPIHVFIDNSNILAGFTTYHQRRNWRNWYRTKLNYDALFRILEDGRNVARKVLVASSPLSQQLTQAEQAGYEVSVLKRIEQKEQGVDEVLHLKILESLLDHHDPSILVLASGDGKDAEYFQGGFHKCVIKALERGWQVEVISWKHQLSHNFSNAKFLKQWKNFYQVIYLDRFAAQLRS